MIFEELDKKMRIYEESLDQSILPDLYMAARLDGRSFTRLTKEICQFEAPFDIRFRDLMIQTTKALMECGFRIVYGFTESDEISLLFSPDELWEFFHLCHTKCCLKICHAIIITNLIMNIIMRVCLSLS